MTVLLALVVLVVGAVPAAARKTPDPSLVMACFSTELLQEGLDLGLSPDATTYSDAIDEFKESKTKGAKKIGKALLRAADKDVAEIQAIHRALRYCDKSGVNLGTDT